MMDWFVGVSDEHRIRFLSRLLVEISIAAREAYLHDPMESSNAIKWLRCCNELVHQVSQQLSHYIEGVPATRRYPDDVFARIVVDTAETLGCGGIIKPAIERARAALSL